MVGTATIPMDDELKEQQQFYDRGWHGELEKGKEQRGNLQTNLEFIDETGLLREGDKLLEIGCGIGSVVHALHKKGFAITGVDISQEAISYGLKKYGPIDLQVQAAEELPYENESFDVVLSFDLFEHIARIEMHVKEVTRVLKTGGYYLFQTPNKYSNVIFETLAHKSLKWRRAHPSLHTPRQLRRRLSRHGFEVDFRRMDPMNEYTIAKLQRFGPFGRILQRINFTKLPLALQTNLYVIAHKTGTTP
jgi:2-polyprenyl-3-methyl-5-hydroxy-6-metoxy-1,4-benzoquinol methylase